MSFAGKVGFRNQLVGGVLVCFILLAGCLYLFSRNEAVELKDIHSSSQEAFGIKPAGSCENAINRIVVDSDPGVEKAYITIIAEMERNQVENLYAFNHPPKNIDALKDYDQYLKDKHICFEYTYRPYESVSYKPYISSLETCNSVMSMEVLSDVPSPYRSKVQYDLCMDYNITKGNVLLARKEHSSDQKEVWIGTDVSSSTKQSFSSLIKLSQGEDVSSVEFLNNSTGEQVYAYFVKRRAWDLFQSGELWRVAKNSNKLEKVDTLWSPGGWPNQ